MMGLRHIVQRLRRAVRPDPIARFFKLPYQDRVAEVQRLYGHAAKRDQLGDWLKRSPAEVAHELDSNIRYFMDVVVGYAEVLAPPAVMQWGSFTMTEGQFLGHAGYKGRFIATDFSADHLAYLRSHVAAPPFSSMEYRALDLERATAADFADATMAVALAVLSNIQPEGIERLFAAVAQSKLDCVLIGDMYVKDSLSVDPRARAVPYAHTRNWCHPYMAVAARHGLEAFFLSDFTYSSFVEARGIFVIHRKIPTETHVAAVAAATRHYLARQSQIWPVYARLDLDKPQIVSVHAGATAE